MDDSKVFATLVAIDDLCADAFALDQDKSRYVPPVYSPYLGVSRDTSPSLYDEGEQWTEQERPYKVEGTHRLLLAFDQPPRSGAMFLFGSHPDCDVRLVDPLDETEKYRQRVRHISQKHFAITFDDERRLVVKAFQNKMSVSYDGQAERQIRRSFTWIVLPHFAQVVIHLPKAKIAFAVQTTIFSEAGASNNKEYIDKLLDNNAEPVFDIAKTIQFLDIPSESTTAGPSGPVTPRQTPIYLQLEEAGEGGFGTVHKMINASTGEIYAGKTFRFSGTKFQDLVEREIDIMRAVEHAHIIRFRDYQATPKRLLLMEFAEYGTIGHQNSRSPLSKGESATVLLQSLSALEYLHSQEKPIAHRDIKPANILVTCRDPLYIKLGDFGLAKPDVTRIGLKTDCGTDLYAAPEIFHGRQYSVKVDIWSLGVVILKLAYRLPDSSKDPDNPEVSSLDEWQRKVSSALDDQPTEELSELLSSGMLRLEASERKSASKCLSIAISIAEKLNSSPTRANEPLTCFTTSPSSTGQRSSSTTPTVIFQPQRRSSKVTKRGYSATRSKSNDSRTSKRRRTPRRSNTIRRYESPQQAAPACPDTTAEDSASQSQSWASNHSKGLTYPSDWSDEWNNSGISISELRNP